MFEHASKWFLQINDFKAAFSDPPSKGQVSNAGRSRE